MEQTKKCGKCLTEKPVVEFVKNKYQGDGYHWECKACVKAYQIANRDKLKEYQKSYQSVYRKENAEELMQYDREWRKANKEKCKEYAKKSMQRPEAKARQREYMKEYNKLWRKNNPEKHKASVLKYNAKVKAIKQNDQ